MDTNAWDHSNQIIVKKIDLKTNWTIYNKENLTLTVRNASLPICVTTALHKSGLIADPLYRYNDIELRWIANNDWWFENYFEVDSLMLNKSNVQLVLDNLDSIANIYINDFFLTNVDNEFLKHKIDNINTKLKLGTNKITILFRSPVKYAALLNATYPYPVPVVSIPSVQHGENGVNFIRKKASSFSWDWGPAFAPMGIYKNVHLNVIDNFDFSFSAAVYPQNVSQDLNSWFIDVYVDIENINNTQRLGEVRVSIDEIGFIDYAPLNTSQSFHHKFVVNTKEGQLKLWYPHGYGEQSLYRLNVSVRFDDNFINKSKTIAFRSVELIQEPVLKDVDGLSFYFKINRIPVFLKGSNWIPASNFQDQVDDSQLEWLMYSSVKANMNVLRIWGGGQYESEKFYDLADQNGILIWHDFMFACNFYPTNLEFLDNVKKEVEYQVKRLRHHPSILIWAGNNENEAALVDDWYNIKADKVLYENDYRTLYISTIRTTVMQIEPTESRPFLSSSPTNGLESERENWLAKYPYDWRYGDVHFYNYFMNGWDAHQYPVSRFLSEFGFQSYPSISTLRPVYNDSDLEYWSELNDHRQHHGNGNNEILYEINSHFNLPNMTNKLDNFTYTIYLAQVHQAVSLKTATELCRRNRDTVNSTGYGNCMGIMYWQLNDLWQAPTWSSIEYSGKWKLAHYYIKHAFSDLLISPIMNLSTQLDVHIISDFINKTISDTLIIKVFNSSGNFQPLYSTNISFQLDPFKTQLATSLNSSSLDPYCSNNCLVTFELALNDVKNFWFSKDKFNQPEDNANSGNVTVVQVTQKESNVFEISLKAEYLSLFVWIDLDTIELKGYFSDNGFHMTSQTKTIQYSVSNGQISLNDFQAKLQIRSIKL